MADFIKGRYAFVGGVEIGSMFAHGEEAAFAFGKGTQIFPNAPVAIWGTTSCRVVLDAGENWFEIGWGIDHEMTGNAATGWTDAGNYLRVEPQWSPDLVNWSMGKFAPAPVPVIDLGGGNWEYWSRALNPQDSAVKTSQLVTGQTNGDPRNNGFTSLVVAGVSLALPNFPYDMTVAGTAVQLAADIGVFHPGTVVTGSTAETWLITIPDVETTDFGQYSWIGFPGYLVPDRDGNLTILVERKGFDGSAVNSEGVSIFKRAFARLKISAGSRYDPYH